MTFDWSGTPVPFMNLGIQRDEIAAEVSEGFARVLDTTAFVGGPDVAAFEEAYAAYCGTAYCVGVGNGTDALELALAAHGIGPGDEVVIPANTFIATAEAVERVGADVILVDCDERYLINIDAVKSTLTERTRAVIAVHLYGQLVDIPSLRAAVGPGVLVVEDAAQSQGARSTQGTSGGLGDIGATSFYPGKNLGAFGDAGAVTTNDPAVATRLRRLRNHGGEGRHEHALVGRNSRLDPLQAVVLRAKLARLDIWNAQRRLVANRYTTLLADAPDIGLPQSPDPLAHVWHLYVVQVPHREAVMAALQEAGIGSGIHYSAPIHLLPAFAHLGLAVGAFPVAEAAADRILSLPMFPGMTAEQVDRVVTALVVAVDNAPDTVGAPA